MNKTVFVTGISTEVGKTVISAIVTESLQADYWKPVQAGDLEYGDKDKVQDMVSNTQSRFFDNTYTLNTPMSPHAAADIDGIRIELEQLDRPATENTLVIEGAGGLLVPLNEQDTIADLILPEDKVLLVSRHYLGSINHTLLSCEYLLQKGIQPGLLFSGDQHPTTESIILQKTGLPILGRVEEEKTFSKEVVAHYAETFRPALTDWLNS
ncbi:dethiobiotin synthase [Aureicoccus marinus]|uniref:ATP-dependent dethiobiotin synthetase BioD n=1 Tax=Aureicoccus marinus TaxID=754435 RepID=A0A2S7T8Y9_9FLAO|nr:dethiobiotin synthase [Aureicoccus marinus]PQJ16400.1 dethiobiotin synthase [Aureicoccus marinus]